MNHILQIFAIYIGQLAFGSALILPFFPNRVTGKSFPRFYYGFILILFAGFLLSLFRLDQFHLNQLGVFALAFWVFAQTFRKEFSKPEEFLNVIFGIVALLWFGVYVKHTWLTHDTLWTATGPLLGFLVSALFLSYHLMNMIFGHWYLVNRRLPISHLIKTCKIMIIVTILRAIATGLAVYFAYTTLSAAEFGKITDMWGHGIFFWARILAGLGVPGLVSVLAYKSAQIGSNQSATGIMYAGVVFVLMGEFLALYLYVLTGYLF